MRFNAIPSGHWWRSALLLLLASCGNRSSNPAIPLPDNTTPPILVAGARPTLLSAYWHRKVLVSGKEVGAPGSDQVEIRGMKYFPRQFATGLQLDLESNKARVVDPGPYAGLDVLATRQYSTYTQYNTDQFTFLRLSRSARVGVIWFGTANNLPTWLKDWTAGSTVRITQPWNPSSAMTFPTFWKPLDAGDHWLGSVEGKSGAVYAILLAEADGKPSPEPVVPQGLEVPKPNTACPAWVYEQYKVRGVDGRWYYTWAPQIDPTYWCYLGSEHGSDPRQFPALARLIESGKIKLAFGYVGAKANTTAFCQNCHQDRLKRKIMDAPISTYKVFAFDDRQGHDWLIQFQIGSSSKARLCQRHHEYDLWVADQQSGELLASLHWMSDTGPALDASANGGVDASGSNLANSTRYRPPLCPENAITDPRDPSFVPMDNSVGRRRIPRTDRNGYETWQPSFPKELGFHNGRAYNIDNPLTRCAPTRDAQGTPTCLSIEQTDPAYNWGENRWFIIPGADQNDGFGIYADQAIATGTFYTAPYVDPDDGKLHLRQATDADAVEQYIQPGLHILHISGERWIPYDPWWVEYKPVPTGTVNFDTHNLERSLQWGN